MKCYYKTVPCFSPMHKEGNNRRFILIVDKWQLLLPPSYISWTQIHYHVSTMGCDVTWCKHSSKTDLLSIWSSAKSTTHIIIMATLKTGTICNIRGFNDDWRVIGTHFDGLVFRTFLSENCYTLSLTLVQLFSIRTCKTELYQSKDWDIWKVFSDAKSTGKIQAPQQPLCKCWIERH